MEIILNNGGIEARVNVPHGTEVGHIRTLRDQLEDIGAPSSFTLAIDGRGVEDSAILSNGCTVTFRPLEGGKG